MRRRHLGVSRFRPLTSARGANKMVPVTYSLPHGDSLVDPTKTFDENVQSAIDHVFKETVLPPHVIDDDVKQDIWVAVLSARQRGLFDPAHPRAFHYVCRIAHNIISANCADSTKRAEFESRAGGRGPGVTHDDDPGETEDLQLQLERLRELVPTLSEKEQLLIQYRFEDGLTIRECARRMGCSREWANKSLTKLLEKLRTKM